MTVSTLQYDYGLRFDAAFAVCVTAAACGAIARVLEASHSPTPGPLFGLGPLEIVVGVIAARRLLANDCGARDTGPAHILAAAALLAPSGAGAWAVLLLYSSWLALRAPSSGREGPLLLAALAAVELWTGVGFKLVAAPFLTMDARLTAWALDLLGAAPVRTGNVVEVASGHSIVILVTCAKMHRLPLAMLSAWALCEAPNWRWRALAALAAALGYVLLNAARLVAMGWSPEAHAFMHDGLGAQVFEAAQVGLVIAIAAGARR